MKVFVVTGNIGAGKTSLLKHIAALTENREYVSVIFEGVDKWKYYLERFYKEPAKDNNSFLFHLDVLEHYFEVTKQLQQTHDAEKEDGHERIVFVERSPSDVLNVFLRNIEEHLTKVQRLALTSTFIALRSIPEWADAHYLLVKTKLNTCIDRMRERNREAEKKVQESYLVRLDGFYSSGWLVPIFTTNNDGEALQLFYSAQQIINEYAK